MIKQTDIAMIIIVTAVSLVAAYFIGGAIINTPESRGTQVEVAIPINPEFPEPDPRVFNDNSINPTERIEIGDSNTDKPFQN